MHTMLLHPCWSSYFIVKCFQAPAGEVAEDDGEHGKSTVLYILVVKIKTFLGAPIQMWPCHMYVIYQWAISTLPCAPLSKQVLGQNLSYENETVWITLKWASGHNTNFHMNCSPQRLILTERQKPIWKWCIVIDFNSRVHTGPGKSGILLSCFPGLSSHKKGQLVLLN